jgi:hypothetical protein
MNSKEQNTSNFSSTLETIQFNIIGNKDYFCDLKINNLFNPFSNQNQIMNFEECLQDNPTLPEKSFINKQVDELSKNDFSNLKEKGENKDKSSDITNIKPQKNQTKKKPKKVKFLIRKTNYSKSGNTTIRNSHRSSNFKNRILRNLFQDIFIDWISTQNKKRVNEKRIPKLKKLGYKNLQDIYKDYMNMKKFKLKEIYSGDCFKKILENDKHIFEFNKKAIETLEYMESKLNCTFMQAFNYFYNKENIISCQNDDILNGLKSKNEYINEKGEKEFLEKYMKELYDNINN